jgi:RNA polymerase sigma factor (sigma-70 family)
VDDRWDELAEWVRALDRDPQAFATIFDHHEGRVFRHSLRLVGSFHDAEDVTAATFLELWRRRDKVRLVQGSTLPWLLVTATNVSFNSRRTLRRYRELLDRLPRGAELDESIWRDLEVDDNHELFEAMKQLNPTDASLLVLTAVDGVPVNEVARLLGMSDGAARVRLHRVRQRLRGELDRSTPLRHKLKGADR